MPVSGLAVVLSQGGCRRLREVARDSLFLACEVIWAKSLALLRRLIFC